MYRGVFVDRFLLEVCKEAFLKTVQSPDRETGGQGTGARAWGETLGTFKEASSGRSVSPRASGSEEDEHSR